MRRRGDAGDKSVERMPKALYKARGSLKVSNDTNSSIDALVRNVTMRLISAGTDLESRIYPIQVLG